MKTLSLFLAWRYLLGVWHERNVSTMVKVCFLGIFIGTFSLALVLSVMNGFEKVTHEKMQSIHAQIIIQSPNNYLDTQALRKIFEQNPALQSWAPSESKQIIAQNQDTELTEVMVLKGIDPLAESQTTALEKKILPFLPQQPALLTDIVHDNQILLGVKAAQSLGVTVGDTVNLLFTPYEPSGKKISLESVPVIVGGLFKTGIEEFDANVVFCSLSWLFETFPDAGVSRIGLKLAPDISEATAIHSLQETLPGLEIFSWKDLYPALVSALKLEKYVMFLLLALITLVASMNIISLLFMQITQKRGDIAILQAMGCSATAVRSIFLYSGFLISFFASLLGLGCAAAACFILDRYPFIELPDVYYVTHLPAKMEFYLFFIVFLVVNILSFLATWIPAQRVVRINIANVLRFEG
jgi:lipoprotein-releasing system permease protein